MKRGLIVGRFQPYHLGHHEGVKNILKEMDELVLVVGSTNESYTYENPFTGGERIEMIARCLKAEKIFDRCYIVPVPDIAEFGLWVARVESYAPKFDVVYTNNPLVKNLFEDQGYEVRKMVSNIKEVESGLIRRELTNGGHYENIIPKQVALYLKEINAFERMKSILAKENKE